VVAPEKLQRRGLSSLGKNSCGPGASRTQGVDAANPRGESEGLLRRKKCWMVDELALRIHVEEGHRHDVDVWDPLHVKVGKMPKAQTGVVAGISDQDAAMGADGPKVFQTPGYQRLSEPLPLSVGQDGDRPQGVPLVVLADHTGREGDMAHDAIPFLGHQGACEGLTGTQSLDDETFGLPAMRVAFEGKARDVEDGRDVRRAFIADLHDEILVWEGAFR
jgi:hypothetical protein